MRELLTGTASRRGAFRQFKDIGIRTVRSESANGMTRQVTGWPPENCRRPCPAIGRRPGRGYPPGGAVAGAGRLGYDTHGGV
ncbi:MAG: hypothetical protein LBS11_08755 [Oscillospiraceae bacterium]|nr:hypothetical protein [Oscillospiraceae bacterium]